MKPCVHTTWLFFNCLPSVNQNFSGHRWISVGKPSIIIRTPRRIRVASTRSLKLLGRTRSCIIDRRREVEFDKNQAGRNNSAGDGCNSSCVARTFRVPIFLKPPRESCSSDKSKSRETAKWSIFPLYNTIVWILDITFS